MRRAQPFRAACAALLLSGCAFTNPENTPLVRTAEEAIAPDSSSFADTLLFLPVALPLGAVDVFICHPVQVIDDAGSDTWDLGEAIWKDPSGGAATQSFFFVPKVVISALALPLWFTGDWLMRSCFDVGAKPDEETPVKSLSAREELEARIAEVRQMMAWRRKRLVELARERAEQEEELPALAAELERLEQQLAAEDSTSGER